MSFTTSASVICRTANTFDHSRYRSPRGGKRRRPRPTPAAGLGSAQHQRTPAATPNASNQLHWFVPCPSPPDRQTLDDCRRWVHSNWLLILLPAVCITRLWLMPLPSSFRTDETATAFVIEHPADPSLAAVPQVPDSVYTVCGGSVARHALETHPFHRLRRRKKRRFPGSLVFEPAR